MEKFADFNRSLSNICLSKKLKSVKNNSQIKGQIIKVQAPIIEISSSFIRSSIKSGKNIRPLLPNDVWKYFG